jgi:hypothetical protein
MPKKLLTIIFLFTIHFSRSQSLLIKYIDLDDAINDFKKKGTKSFYFDVIHPSYILYLNCGYYDLLHSLYLKADFDNLSKEDYCLRDSTQIETFSFSAKSFREIFDDDSKIKAFVRKIPNIHYDEDVNVNIDYPIYLYNAQALIAFSFSNGSAVYRMSLLNNQIKYVICTSIIE